MHVDVSGHAIRIPFLLARKLRRRGRPSICVLGDFYRLGYGVPSNGTTISVQFDESESVSLDHLVRKYAIRDAYRSTGVHVRDSVGRTIYAERLDPGTSESILLVVDMPKSGAGWETPRYSRFGYTDFRDVYAGRTG